MLVLLQPRKHEAMLPSSGRMMQYRCVFNKNHDKMEPAARPWQCRSEDPRLPLRKSEGKGGKKKQIKQQQKTNTKIAPPAVEIKAVILCGIWTTTFSNARCGADGLEIIELWQSRTETQCLSTKKKKFCRNGPQQSQTGTEGNSDGDTAHWRRLHSVLTLLFLCILLEF